MFFFTDFLVLWCLFTAGYFFGCYCKYTLIYDTLLHLWNVLIGVMTALIVAAVWTTQKYFRKQYSFNHCYIIFYGLIAFVLSACFMLSNNFNTAFYFGFIGLSTIFIASFSFICLRCSANGMRPMRIALGNTLFFIGLTVGFEVFNLFEPFVSGCSLLGITLTMLLGMVISEILQYTKVQCYKKSCDLVFNLLNDEKIIFSSRKSINALYIDRPEFYFTKNRQWMIVGVASLAVFERIFIFSPTLMQIFYSATPSVLNTQYLCGPFLLITFGCAFGSCLMIRYRPKMVYLMFGLIKITVIAAMLSVYEDDYAENCFYLLCFYFISMGVYSSVALQLILECTAFLYTELALSLAFSMKLLSLETFKYEMDVGSETALLGISISSIVLTIACLVTIPLFVPPSEGLIAMRNRLLGIRKHSTTIAQAKFLSVNDFHHHDKQANDFTNVCFNGNRVFQQYPSIQKY